MNCYDDFPHIRSSLNPLLFKLCSINNEISRTLRDKKYLYAERKVTFMSKEPFMISKEQDIFVMTTKTEQRLKLNLIFILKLFSHLILHEDGFYVTMR